MQAACPLPPRCHRASLPGRRRPVPVLCEEEGHEREEGTPLLDRARLGQRREIQRPYLLMGRALQQLLLQLHLLLGDLPHFKIHLKEQRNTVKRPLLPNKGVCPPPRALSLALTPTPRGRAPRRGRTCRSLGLHVAHERCTVDAPAPEHHVRLPPHTHGAHAAPSSITIDRPLPRRLPESLTLAHTLPATQKEP